MENASLKMRKKFQFFLLVGGVLCLGWLGGLPGAEAQEYPAYDNTVGIKNTRHNLIAANAKAYMGTDMMRTTRNQYGEICVYCHTPHGANENIAAPLWNRTFKSNTYTTYDQLGTSSLTSEVNAPGINSLTCLSCHDGTVAIDSVVNMPGSGGYSAASKTSHQEGFLDSFTPTNGVGTAASKHFMIGPTNGVAESSTCLVCHADGPATIDFRVAFIGLDLTNDHPVGVDLPSSRIGIDFIGPDVSQSKIAFYDNDMDSRADSNEIRFYKTGSTYRVECASCHDPHGVAPVSGGALNPTFLRVNNADSTVCLTCHVK